MPKQKLVIIKRVAEIPLLGRCGACGREFSVAVNSMNDAAEALGSIRDQYDAHTCEPKKREAFKKPDEKLSEE